MGWTRAAPRRARRGMIVDTVVKNQHEEFRTRRLSLAVRCVALCFWIIFIPSNCSATMSVFWPLLLLRFSLYKWIIWQKTVRQRRFMLIHLNNSNIWHLSCLQRLNILSTNSVGKNLKSITKPWTWLQNTTIWFIITGAPAQVTLMDGFKCQEWRLAGTWGELL